MLTPYRIAGDVGLAEADVEAYMLLDASSQRAKSWACEHCPNMAANSRQPSICNSRYWAFPLHYDHIAMQQIRRTDIAWQGTDVEVHDQLEAIAAKRGTDVATLLKTAARQIAKRS
jgi:hypothetical protein